MRLFVFCKEELSPHMTNAIEKRATRKLRDLPGSSDASDEGGDADGSSEDPAAPVLLDPPSRETVGRELISREGTRLGTRPSESAAAELDLSDLVRNAPAPARDGAITPERNQPHERLTRRQHKW